MRVLVAGGSGFIGRQVVRRLDHPIVASRDPERAARRVGEVDEWICWDPAAGAVDMARRGPVDAVVNLMGRSIGQRRWTRREKQRLMDSRVAATRNLVASLRGMTPPPQVLVSASAVGYYGSCGERVVDESCGPGGDFLATLCRHWEAEAHVASEFGTRVVCLRMGIVLGRAGGALKRLVPFFRWGLGGRLGSGRQWMPWIHEADLVELILFALQSERLVGPVNAVAPHPVSNRDLTRALARTVRRPAVLPVPSMALWIAFGELGRALTASQRVVPSAAISAGFLYRFPYVTAALEDLFRGF